jgi:hypothetical protein
MSDAAPLRCQIPEHVLEGWTVGSFRALSAIDEDSVNIEALRRAPLSALGLLRLQ